MTGWLIALGIAALIALFPIGASVRYDAEGAAVRLIAGPVKLLLYPRKKKEQKKPKPAPKQEAPEKPAPAQPKSPIPEPKPAPGPGGDIRDFLPLVDVALDLLSGLGSRLRVNYLQLRLTLAGDDPCDLAVNYGRANAAGAALLAQLERFLVIKRRDVQIQCDFTTNQTTVLARLDLTITIGRLLSLAAVYGVRGLITFLKIKKQREGGASI